MSRPSVSVNTADPPSRSSGKAEQCRTVRTAEPRCRLRPQTRTEVRREQRGLPIPAVRKNLPRQKLCSESCLPYSCCSLSGALFRYGTKRKQSAYRRSPRQDRKRSRRSLIRQAAAIAMWNGLSRRRFMSMRLAGTVRSVRMAITTTVRPEPISGSIRM